MKTFIYKGKERSAAGNNFLCPGEKYELDENDLHVKSLAAKGLLKECKVKSKIDSKQIQNTKK